MSIADPTDFLNNQHPTVFEPDSLEHGPNLTTLKKMSPRQFAQGVLNVYQELGGDSWLLSQARLDPKSFIEILKKILPNSIALDNLSDFQITLVNRFGDKIEIESTSDDRNPYPSPENRSKEAPQLTAEPIGRDAGAGGLPSIDIKERFGDDSQTVTGNNLDPDFTL